MFSDSISEVRKSMNSSESVNKLTKSGGGVDTALPVGVTRREALRAGTAGLLGVAMSSLPNARVQAAAAPFPAEADRYWPQAAGPHGTWGVDATDAPIHWSGARDEHFAWRTTLPEVGQGGIAVWGDRAFVTTLKPEEGKRPDGKEVIGYCLDARNGKILWSVALPGSTASVPAYFFSDATSPSPITDGKHVWFFNACGSVGCYDYDGAKVWLREWEPTTNKRPFNKQFEPMLFGDAILNMEPRDADDPKREADPWNYLRGIDRKTGKPLWVADDAMTHYNTPVFGVTADGRRPSCKGAAPTTASPRRPSVSASPAWRRVRRARPSGATRAKARRPTPSTGTRKTPAGSLSTRPNTWSSTPPMASRCAPSRWWRRWTGAATTPMRASTSCWPT